MDAKTRTQVATTLRAAAKKLTKKAAPVGPPSKTLTLAFIKALKSGNAKPPKHDSDESPSADAWALQKVLDGDRNFDSRLSKVLEPVISNAIGHMGFNLGIGFDKAAGPDSGLEVINVENGVVEVRMILIGGSYSPDNEDWRANAYNDGNPVEAVLRRLGGEEKSPVGIYGNDGEFVFKLHLLIPVDVAKILTTVFPTTFVAIAAAGPPDLRFRGQGSDQPRFRHLEVGDVFDWSGRQVEVKSVEVKPTFIGKQVTIKTTNGQTITMSDATMVEGLRKHS